MRHGKSDQLGWALTDFDKPLNACGKRAAALIGSEILKRDIVPDVILSSPAKRAKQTAEHVAKKCGYRDDIVFVEQFYLGDEFEIIMALRDLADDINRVLAVGHNPVLEFLTSKLLYGSGLNIRIPEAALVSITSGIDCWGELKVNASNLQGIITPEDLKKS